MAFNGSGTFNLVTGNPVVTGTTISSTWANNTLSDVASGLTNCVTRDGQSPATANLPMGNYKLIGVGAPAASGDALAWGSAASVTDLTVSNLTASRAVVTDGSKNLASSAVTATELGYLSGVTSAIQTQINAILPSGTSMLFVQTSAPTGWTKSTTHNNKALRVVSGSASSGGSVAFTTAFASQTPSGSVSVSGGSVASTTLSTSEIPSHNHSVTVYGLTISAPTGGSNGAISTISSGTTGSTGGGGSHTHSFTQPTASFSGSAINLAVQYVDVIIATKV